MAGRWLHYRHRRDLDCPATYWLAHGLARDDVWLDAHRRLDLGHPVTIHHHPAREDCRPECERLTPQRARRKS